MFFSCCLFPVAWNGMYVGFLAYFRATFIIMAYCSMKSVSVMLGCSGRNRKNEGRRTKPNDCGLNALSFVCTALSKHKSQTLPTLAGAGAGAEAHPSHTETHIYKDSRQTTHKLMSIACAEPFVIPALLPFFYTCHSFWLISCGKSATLPPLSFHKSLRPRPAPLFRLSTTDTIPVSCGS